ncbi:coenzyme F430 synthase [Methanocaldococcus infernus]
MKLIVDVNHGALELAKHYLFLGYDVAIYDIYNKLEKSKEHREIFENLKEKFGVELINNPEFSSFDEVIAPIHCPLTISFTSFHDAVSFIIKKRFKDKSKRIICITGVKGKTTTTEILYSLLKDDYEIALHNSNRGSIAPPDILDLLEREEKDLYIFECSLGLVESKYGVITNILENYPIAKRKRRAIVKFLTTKNCETCYVNKEDLVKYNIEVKGNFKVLDTEVKILKKYPLRFLYMNEEIELNESCLGLHHIKNSIFALEIAKNYMDIKDAIKKLKNIKIKNRMEVKGKVVRNINPGLDVKAIEYSIRDYLSIFDGPIYIGGDFGVTCEEIDIKKLSEVLKKFKAKYVFVGEIGKELLKYIDGEYLEEIDEVEEGLIIIRHSL